VQYKSHTKKLISTNICIATKLSSQRNISTCRPIHLYPDTSCSSGILVDRQLSVSGVNAALYCLFRWCCNDHATITGLGCSSYIAVWVTVRYVNITGGRLSRWNSNSEHYEHVDSPQRQKDTDIKENNDRQMDRYLHMRALKNWMKHAFSSTDTY